MNSWDLIPTDEEVREHMRPNGLTSRNDAHRAALREKLIEALGSTHHEPMTPALQIVVAVLQAAFEGGIL